MVDQPEVMGQSSLLDSRRVLEVNLVAPFLLAKAFGTKMLAARSGCIINVAMSQQ